jgi:hypothetical protein
MLVVQKVEPKSYLHGVSIVVGLDSMNIDSAPPSVISSCSFCLRNRRLHSKNNPNKTDTNATPPTTPPAIAPGGVLLPLSNEVEEAEGDGEEPADEGAVLGSPA